MTKNVVSKARDWGSICNYEPAGTWQILPQQKNQRWKLQLEGERWLLIVGNIPQISFPPDEAIAVLELRRPPAKRSKS